jgi:hypothetical protein
MLNESDEERKRYFQQRQHSHNDTHAENHGEDETTTWWAWIVDTVAFWQYY